MKKRTPKYDLNGLKKIIGIALFLFSFIWFCFPGEYVLIANRDLTLFRTTSVYLLSFLDRPGGLLDYFGSFLSQFFRFRVAGALLLAGIIATIYYVTGSLISRVSDHRERTFFGVVAAILFLGMHNYYPHQLSHSLGFILAIGLAAAYPVKRTGRWVFLAVAVPLIYLVSGGFIWIFCGVLLLEEVFKGRGTDFISLLLIVLYPLLVILGGSGLIWLDPLKELISMYLPFGEEYGRSPWPWLFVGGVSLLMIFAGIRKPGKILSPLWKNLFETTICLVGMVLVLHFSYNRKNAEFFHIEKLAIGEEWDGLLEYSRQHPSGNLFGSFYTNMALVKSGQLCNDLFRYPQSFGRKGLCFEWDAKGEILRRGSDFFWTVNFVNEAHHWAFESMVVDGFTRRNLKRLIETELVRGNFRVAEKYINLLGSTMFHRKLADHYTQFLFNRAAIESDPELGPIMNNHLKQDFFSEGMNLDKNLRMLLANNSSNGPAYDYLMALLLLEKEVDQIAALLPGYLRAHNGIMPLLLDETLLVYKITHKEGELSNIRVSNPTIQRFEEYTQILRQQRSPEEAARTLYPVYQHSFWFYLNFSSLTNR